MPTNKEKAFSDAKSLLLAHGFSYEVSLEELYDWFSVSTAYPDFSLDEVLSRPLLVVHEIVEIAEVKRMGLLITKDVILKNPGPVYEAHLNAFEVELALAKNMSDWRHIRARLRDVRNWTEDPLLPQRLKLRCKMLYAQAEEALREGLKKRS